MNSRLDIVHLPPIEALVTLIRFSIANGDDDDFIETVRRTGGFAVYSHKSLWPLVDRLGREAANGGVFPEDSEDRAQFLAVCTDQGFSEARRWIRRRMPISGWEWLDEQNHGRGRTQRVLWIPANSRLEQSLRRKPTTKRRETASFIEKEK